MRLYSNKKGIETVFNFRTVNPSKDLEEAIEERSVMDICQGSPLFEG